MTINKKTITVVCAILLSVFLVLGCQLAIRPTPTGVGSQDQDTTPTAAPFTQQDATRDPAARETATPESEPVLTPEPVEVPERNELRLFSPSDPETLDPALVQDMTSHRFVSLLFSGLVTLDSDLQVAPDLAERWEVDDSGTVYTFYLNQDAKFHNGQPVTAEDVIYSLERAADPERGSVKRAESYLDDIVGVKERTSGKAKSISGIKALDEYTVQITIDAPKPYFLAKLTYPTAFVVNKENVEQTRSKWTAHPIGTGPFKMAENGHTQMVLEAFDEYHRGRPKLDRLTFVYRGQSMNLYERGELDVIEVGAEYIDRVLDPNDPLYDDLRIVSQIDVWYIGFNVAKPPFDDPNVRRAFAYATNKAAIAEIAFNKMVLPAKGILPPGLPGYNADLEGLSYDPTARPGRNRRVGIWRCQRTASDHANRNRRRDGRNAGRDVQTDLGRRDRGPGCRLGRVPARTGCPRVPDVLARLDRRLSGSAEFSGYALSQPKRVQSQRVQQS